MVAIIIFIVILGLLIFVHELGHFVIARRNGIKAEEFGFGFPPRIFGFIRSEETGRFRFVPGNQEVKSKNTVYSLNWIPLGGFVRIKGENGENRDEDSFATKGAWIRVKVLAAGVFMNFILAWALISLGLAIGAPEAIDSSAAAATDSKIQISEVLPASPAETAGIRIGDEVLKDQTDSTGQPIRLERVKDVQEYINSQKGREIRLKIRRGSELLNLKTTPRADAPEGQGPLGVALTETALVRYAWYEAIWKGLGATLDITWAILVAFGGLIYGLFLGQGVGADISGPVGIAVLTKEVAGLGFVYILQFAALLSINLGIINALPVPALDGGRILFVLIEKIRRKPVSQKVEQMIHTIGFVLLITLMILVTFRDVAKFVK